MVAWLDLAEVRERMGRLPQAAQARERARQEACRAPRGYPYAIGSEALILGHRMLLVWGGAGLRPALPAFYRDACALLEQTQGGVS